MTDELHIDRCTNKASSDAVPMQLSCPMAGLIYLEMLEK